MRLRYTGKHGPGPVSVMASKEIDGEEVWADIKWWASNAYVADAPEWLGEHLLDKDGANWEIVEGELGPLPKGMNL